MCNQGSMRLSTRYRLVPAPSKEISPVPTYSK